MISEVHNCDCMEYMKTVPDKYFELAIVDPPYGIGIITQFKDSNKVGGNSMFHQVKGIRQSEWDSNIPDKEYFIELFRVSQNQIIWGGNYFLDYLHSTKSLIIWDKMNGTNNMADAEIAWSSFDSHIRIFRLHHFSAGYDEKIHLTQKPTKLYKWTLKNYAKEGDKIFDSHMGSQSSRIACYDGGFDFVGCELDPDYFRDGCKRFENHIKQLKFAL